MALKKLFIIKEAGPGKRRPLSINPEKPTIWDWSRRNLRMGSKVHLVRPGSKEHEEGVVTRVVSQPADYRANRPNRSYALVKAADGTVHPVNMAPGRPSPNMATWHWHEMCELEPHNFE